MTDLKARPAEPPDAPQIAEIYNHAIEERIATFETRLRTPEEVTTWLNTLYPVLVVTENNQVVGFAATSQYRPRDCYNGVAEFSVYVHPDHRQKGVGKTALTALFQAAKQAGFHKLLSRIFPENTPSLTLMKSLGFREVGTYQNHAQLDGQWRDVVIVEKLL